jgi:hypothetical protein
MGYYDFDGDPAVDSTRRHLERVLNEPQIRRWAWLMAVLTGGAALGLWRSRRKSPERARSAPTGTSREATAR